MQATTIKLENPLLAEIKKFIPKDESLTSYVRQVLEREVQRRKLVSSAEQYCQFLKENPQEQEWLELWEATDLTKEINR